MAAVDVAVRATGRAVEQTPAPLSHSAQSVLNRGIRTMRIAHFANELGARGGIASYVQRVGRAQKTRGHEVFFLSRSPSDDAPLSLVDVNDDRALFERAQDLDLDILHLHRPVGTLPDDRVPTLRTMHGNHGSCPSGSRYLKRAGSPCHRSYSAAGCLWGHLVDHCGSRRPQNAADNFRNFHRERALTAEIPTLTVSRFLKEQMVESGCSEDHLQVLHSPAPDIGASFSPPPQATPPQFVFAGRIEPKKGLDWLLQAVAATEVDVHLNVAGTGNEEYMARMTELVSELGIGDAVTFHGWLEEEDVYALIEQSRALVFPSVWHEPAGLVTLEAAALGRPVIASAVGGIPEYATDDFALRVSPRDVDGLASRIDALARDPERARTLGQAGWTNAQTRFSMDDFLDRLHGVYRDLCGRAANAAVRPA